MTNLPLERWTDAWHQALQTGQCHSCTCGHHQGCWERAADRSKPCQCPCRPIAWRRG